MLVETRGGIPVPQHVTATAAGVTWPLKLTSKYFQIANQGAAVVRLYFSQADFAANLNWVPLDTLANEGYFEGPAEIDTIWLRSEGADSLCIAILYQRRG